MPSRAPRAEFDPAPHRAALCAIIDAVRGETELDARRLDRIVRRHPKHGSGLFSKSEIIAGFRAFADAPAADAAEFVRRLRMRPVRTLSGVTPVTVLTKPFPCPGTCVFCPNDVRMPKSYLADEPGAQRAEDNRFDPYLQTWNRLDAYQSMGHPTDKVELIVLGGTWSHHPETYQRWFVARCFDALSDFGAGIDARAAAGVIAADYRALAPLDGRAIGDGDYNRAIARHLAAQHAGALLHASEQASWEALEAAQRRNETASVRCVGLALETRPDQIDAAETRRLRRLGATKIQLGVQSLDDAILAANRRGHDVAATRAAFAALRGAGFKLHAHWMANLLGATPAHDAADYRRLFADADFRPDELKLYPCLLVPSAALAAHHARGEWLPYADDVLVELLAGCIAATPRWCRLTRVVRDFSAHDVAAGTHVANLREVAERALAARGERVAEIRSREVRGHAVAADALSLRDTAVHDVDRARALPRVRDARRSHRRVRTRLAAGGARGRARAHGRGALARAARVRRVAAARRARGRRCAARGARARARRRGRAHGARGGLRCARGDFGGRHAALLSEAGVCGRRALPAPEHGLNARLTAVLACAIVAATAAFAEPNDLERRAFRAGVARSVLEPAVSEALERAEFVRVVIVFEEEPGEPSNRRPDATVQRLAPLGFAPARRFVRLPVLTGFVNARALAALLDDPHVARVGVEPSMKAQLAEAVPLVNLDDLHAAGENGAGAQVAILDTGVDLAHPDLAGAVVAQHCFCDDGAPGPGGCCPNGQNEQSGAGSGQDDHGHGTRVAGIITSAGVHAPLGGAPDAQLVAVKVLNAGGGGSLSDILAGLDWVLAFQPGVSVINLSLAAGLYPADCDAADAVTSALASAVDQLHAAGVLTVAGAGNNGSGVSMGTPACLAKVVSVGAVWDANVGSQTLFGCTDATTAPSKVACWSNSSTTTDVFAPGALMTSSLLGGTSITLAGTSYATPIVAACAATLAAAHPDATPTQITTALRTSPVSVVDPKNSRSYPRLDCFAADQFLRAPSVPSLSNRALPWLAALLVLSGLVVLGARARRVH
jgi:elongator complex protein 3